MVRYNSDECVEITLGSRRCFHRQRLHDSGSVAPANTGNTGRERSLWRDRIPHLRPDQRTT